MGGSAGAQLHDSAGRRIQGRAAANAADNRRRVRHVIEIFLQNAPLREVEGIQDVAVVVDVGTDNAVGEYLGGCVNVHRVVLLEELGVFEVMQRAEHNARVVHRVAIEHGHRIGELLVVLHLGIDSALGSVFLMIVMVKIEAVVIGVLHDGVVHIGPRDVDPGIDIGVFRHKCCEINGVLHAVVRRHVLRRVVSHGRFGDGRVLQLLGGTLHLGVLPYDVADTSRYDSNQNGQDDGKRDCGGFPLLRGAGGLLPTVLPLRPVNCGVL